MTSNKTQLFSEQVPRSITKCLRSFVENKDIHFDGFYWRGGGGEGKEPGNKDGFYHGRGGEGGVQVTLTRELKLLHTV